MLSCLPGCREDKLPPPATMDPLVRAWHIEPAEITLTLTPASPLWQQAIHMTLQVALPKNYRPQFPKIEQPLGELYVAARSDPEVVRGDGEVYVYTQEFRLEALQAGKNIIPAMEFGYSEAGKDSTSKGKPLRTEAVVFEVQPGTATSKQELTDIRDVVALPERQPIWLLAALPVLFAIALAVYWRYHRRKLALAEERTPTPEEIARESLAKLLAAPFLQEHNYKPFYFTLTGIVREYLENAYYIRAPRQTTEEFLHNICQYENFSLAMVASLRDFLQKSDVVKYAKSIPAEAEIVQVIATAKEVIAQREKAVASQDKIFHQEGHT
jgi:hypothetical protein